MMSLRCHGAVSSAHSSCKSKQQQLPGGITSWCSRPAHSHTAARQHLASCPKQHLNAINTSGRQARVATHAAAAGGAVAQGDVLVEEVMNPKPVLLREDMSIKDAVHTMLDANIAGAPVVDASGKITGVLCESDVIWKGTGKPEEYFIIPPVYIGALDAYLFLRDNKAFEEETHKILARTVKDAMVGKEKVKTITPGAPMSDAAQMMVHHNINLLPVVESDGSVIGIVTRHDILRGMYASKNPLL